MLLNPREGRRPIEYELVLLNCCINYLDSQNFEMDPRIFQYGVQRIPKFENLDTSLDDRKLKQARFLSHGQEN